MLIKVKKVYKKFLKEVHEVYRTLRKSQKSLTPLWLSSMAINFSALALPLTMLQAYDRILPYHGVGTLQSLTLLMVLILCLEFFLKYLRSYLTAWGGSVFEHNSTVDSMNKIIHCDLEEFESYGSKEIQNKFNEISKLRTFFSGQALTTIVDFPFIFVFLFVIYLIGESLVIIPIFFFLLITYLAILMGKKIRIEMKEKSIRETKIFKNILESFDTIEAIKCSGLESEFKKKHEYLLVDNLSSSYQALFFNGLAFNFGFVFSQLMTMGVLGFGAYKIIHGELGVGGLAACTILSGRIMQPVQKILGLWTRFQGLNVSFKNLKDINNLRTVKRKRYENIPILGNVEFKNVDLEFNDRPLLKNFSSFFDVGDIVYFKCSNNITSSRICDVLLGISEVDSGEVLIDQTNPYNVENAFHKEHISYLSANNSLFKGSILENVSAFGSISKDLALDSCTQLGLDDLISTLPMGYATKLESLGCDPISPGIKQKVMLSRALASHAKILVFDNADIGLDRTGYNKLFSILGKKSTDNCIFIFSDDHNFTFLSNITVNILDDGKWEIVKTKRKFVPINKFPSKITDYYEHII
ncbi:ABC transporter transmembrane domain-containing protein [Halobacteriovorax sp. HLS]|uniref:ABC transporter transmembrane domain-containing protein n=1 Tax=Halobacteriovorax sp. HLS TaxID=2234000 RepID=UPI000FDB8EE6|nr:ABC transporter transmembrane domain-containing protein [Halobacteriovorax sp. HLS]